MSHYCDPCERWFHTWNGYNQHINTSAAHNAADYECYWCTSCFSSEYAREQHHEKAPGHPYCAPCKRWFQGMSHLQSHLHSSVHMGQNIECPFCKRGFVTASGVVIHLESGTCSSGCNRQQINAQIQRLDRNNVITRPMITMPGYDDQGETIATARSWNGSGYQCYLCQREFNSLRGLNSHLSSPAHEQKIYRCPGRGCGGEFKLLSGLVQHVESERCGVMRFATVQQQAKNGIQNMVGRMIQG